MKNLHYLNNSFDRVYYFLFFYFFFFDTHAWSVILYIITRRNRIWYCNAINRILKREFTELLRNFSRINLSCGTWKHTSFPCVSAVPLRAKVASNVCRFNFANGYNHLRNAVWSRPSVYEHLDNRMNTHIYWMLFWFDILISLMLLFVNFIIFPE